MTPDRVFSLVNLIALSAWILLALWPRRRWIVDVVAGGAVPGLLATIYVAIVVTSFGSSSGGFGTLASVAALFSNRWLLLAGWVHYLAFDLLIGSWEVGDARDRGIPHLLVLPCLILTFLFGPAGWLDIGRYATLMRRLRGSGGHRYQRRAFCGSWSTTSAP